MGCQQKKSNNKMIRSHRYRNNLKKERNKRNNLRRRSDKVILTKNVKRIRRKNQRGGLPYLIGPIVAAIAAIAVNTALAAKAAAAGAIAAKAAIAANAGAMAIGAAKASAIGGISVGVGQGVKAMMDKK